MKNIFFVVLVTLFKVLKYGFIGFCIVLTVGCMLCSGKNPGGLIK